MKYQNRQDTLLSINLYFISMGNKIASRYVICRDPGICVFPLWLSSYENQFDCRFIEDVADEVVGSLGWILNGFYTTFLLSFRMYICAS